MRKSIEIFKQLKVNLPLCDLLLQVPKYAKYLTQMLMKKKRIDNASTHILGEESLAILINKEKLLHKHYW